MSGCAVALWLPAPMTVFVLSIPIPRLAASVDMVGCTEGFKSLTCAEHCPPWVDRTVITGAEIDVCWYPCVTLVDDATFSASSVLSIHRETFVRLSSGVSTGEILRMLGTHNCSTLAPFVFRVQHFGFAGHLLLQASHLLLQASYLNFFCFTSQFL